ncbi:MAG: thiamine pyrophosphate-binding protein, partial [Deltaproteobacteria bacterium]|nr:thiamine pyrophosphate-binding protein [Deltaproteobacteria bacterium]
MKGADAVLACLRAEGIKYIFGNPGTTEIPLLDALSAAADINYLVTLHESVAVGMADGYARSGGGVGFVSVHTAAGTSNCLGGLYNALIVKSPIVVTAGCKDTRLLGRDCFSEVPDFAGLPRQFTKLSWAVLRSDRIAENLLHGIKTAATQPCGPVFMTFSEDLLDQEVELGEVVSQIPRTSLAFAGDQHAIQEAARLLVVAKNPLLIAGSEIAKRAAMSDVVALADLLGVPVMTEGRNSLSTLNFPHTHPAFRGPFVSSSAYVQNADVVLGIGCKMFTQVAYSPEPDIPKQAKIIHFHSDPHELARLYREEVSVLSDAKKGIVDLIEAIQPLLTVKVKKSIKVRVKALKIDGEAADRLREEEIASAWNKKPIQMPRLVRELQTILNADAIIVDEAGRSSRSLLKYYGFHLPG